MNRADSVDRFFDSYAGGFDSIYGGRRNFIDRIIDRLFRKSMLRRFELTVKECDPVEGKNVLDIGCGPGHYGIVLAQRGAGKVVGIDFAPGMLKRAVDHALKAGVYHRCEFIRMDFMDFKPSENFDYTIIMGVMDYILDPRPFIEHVRELTGGKAFFSFPSSRHWLALQRKIRYKFKCDLYLYSRDEVKRLFDNSDFGSYEIVDLGRDFFVIARP
jgi:2-polyprenyl-3-methyl-5-hydroxy-6-metoxy-1,4-benzoquinol methylase